MTLIEEEVISMLACYLCCQKICVDDKHSYVNPGKVDFILTKLNSYHPNIQFTFELEKNKQMTFLDALLQRTDSDEIETCVHRKDTCTDLYINRNVHTPLEWKIGTLRNLVKHAKTVFLRNYYYTKKQNI